MATYRNIFRNSIGNHINTTGFQASIKSIAKDIDNNRPSLASVFKHAISIFPDDYRSAWVQESAKISKEVNGTARIMSGEVMPCYVEALPYIIVAGILQYNAYYIKDFMELVMAQVSMVNILLQFISFRGQKIVDKVTLCKNLINDMIKHGIAPVPAYQKALSSVNKMPPPSLSMDNTNNNNNNNFKSYNRGFNKYNRYNNNRSNNYRGRGGYKNRSNYYNNNNNNSNNNNNIQNKLLLDLLSEKYSTSDSNNNTNISINNRKNNNNKTNKKHVQPHICIGFNCSEPGCLAGSGRKL